MNNSGTLFRHYIQKSNLAMAKKVYDTGLVHIANTCSMSGWPSLFFAVANNDLDMMKWLIEKGHERHGISRDNFGNTALMIAIESHAFDAFELYFSTFPHSANIPNNASLYPLLLVCQKGYTDLLKILLDASPAVITNAKQQCDRRGGTALHHAANWGQYACIEMLFDYGAAEYSAVNRDGWKAVDFAYDQSVEQFITDKIAEIESIEHRKLSKSCKSSQILNRKDSDEHLHLTRERKLTF